MGASLADILPEFRALWIQTGVYFLATCLVFRQQLRSARLKANLPAEVAEEEDEADELLEAKNQELLEAKNQELLEAKESRASGG